MGKEHFGPKMKWMKEHCDPEMWQHFKEKK